MKAVISELWQTGRELIKVEYEKGDSEVITSISDLRKCENVIVDKRGQYGYYDVMIDDSIVKVKQGKATHPYGGTIHFIEVF